MIYKLEQSYLAPADEAGMKFICMQTEGLYFLAQAESLPVGFESEAEYPDSQLAELYAAPEYRQPGGID